MVGKERSCHFLQQRGATDKNTEGYYGGKRNTGALLFRTMVMSSWDGRVQERDR